MSASIEFRQSMFSLIEQWQQSGLSQKSFCAQQGVIPHSFYYWYKCYRSENDAHSAQPSNEFVEITTSDNPDPAPAIELFLAAGHRIVFHHSVSASFIKALIN